MANRLRELLSQGTVMAPGAYDALSARLVEQAKFSAVYLTGFGVSVSRLGKPDLGFITGSEMADTLYNVAKTVRIPIIADADTGYGGALNTLRTIELYEDAGAAAIQIEDQQWPKRCGHIQGKTLIPREEMVGKIKAAVEGRSRDTLIIARTDAIAVEGFDSAIRRAECYLKAGADVLFVEAPETVEQLESIPKLLPATHLINLAEIGVDFGLTADELGEIGYRLAIYPGTALMVAARAMSMALGRLHTERSTKGLREYFLTAKDYFDIVGLYDYLQKDKRYAADATELTE